MKTALLKKICLTMLPLLIGGMLWGQRVVKVDSPNLAVSDEATEAELAQGIIFSNLGPTATNKYDSRVFAKLAVAGKSVIGVPETWVAINFIPKRDVQARVLLAAITYVSGTKLVNLGLYLSLIHI